MTYILKFFKWLFYVFLGVVLLLVIIIASLIRRDIPVEKLIPIYTDETSAFFEVDGMQLHYRVEGNGPDLLLIHGTFASLHTWDDWTNYLRVDFRIIRLDLPGFGLTGPNPFNDYSTTATLHVLEKLREEVGSDAWSIAGNSLGGRIALDYARYFPERTDKLILLNAAAGFSRPTVTDTSIVSNQTASTQRESLTLRAINHPKFRNFLSILTPEFAFRYSLREVYADPERITPEQITRYYHLLRRSGNRQGFLTRNQGAFDGRPVLPALPEATPINDSEIPMLIIWGEQDTWIPVSVGHRLHQQFPNSELVIFEDAGHVPMEEIPQATAYETRKFLLSLD